MHLRHDFFNALSVFSIRRPVGACIRVRTGLIDVSSLHASRRRCLQLFPRETPRTNEMVHFMGMENKGNVQRQRRADMGLMHVRGGSLLMAVAILSEYLGAASSFGEVVCRDQTRPAHGAGRHHVVKSSIATECDRQKERMEQDIPFAGMLRLRGGGQGWYIDEAQKQQKRGRILSSHGEGKHIFDTMMSLEHFPEKLEPLPLPSS